MKLPTCGVDLDVGVVLDDLDDGALSKDESIVEVTLWLVFGNALMNKLAGPWMEPQRQKLIQKCVRVSDHI